MTNETLNTLIPILPNALSLKLTTCPPSCYIVLPLSMPYPGIFLFAIVANKKLMIIRIGIAQRQAVAYI